MKCRDNAVFYRGSWKEVGFCRGTGFIRNSRILIQNWSNHIWFPAFNLVLFITWNTCSNLLCPHRALNLWGFTPLFIEEDILETVRGFIKLLSTLEDYTFIQSAYNKNISSEVLMGIAVKEIFFSLVSELL